MTFRLIEALAGLAPSGTERGPVPEQRWLPITDLRVDDAYQRPITASGRSTVRAIVEAFDWRMFAPVVVCPVEGGIYAIVDGQHRTTAAATCGLESVPCLIIQADRVMQARSFSAINGRVTRMTGGALFKARLAAGDTLARRVDAVTKAAGCRLLTSHKASSQMKSGDTTALRMIECAVTAHGDAVVTLALSAAVASTGGTGGLVNALCVGAFVNVIADHAEWRERRDLVETCSQFPLEEEIERGRVEAARKRMQKQPLLEAALVTFLSLRFDRERPPRRIAAMKAEAMPGTRSRRRPPSRPPPSRPRSTPTSAGRSAPSSTSPGSPGSRSRRFAAPRPSSPSPPNSWCRGFACITTTASAMRSRRWRPRSQASPWRCARPASPPWPNERRRRHSR